MKPASPPSLNLSLNLSLSLILVLTLSSCSKKIIPQKPVLAGNQYITDTLPLSQIDIPVTINLKPLYAMAEKNTQAIYSTPNWPNDWVVENCDTRYKYLFRRGPMNIQAQGNTVQLGFTGSYAIFGAQRACISNTGVTPWSPACSCGLNEAPRRVNIGFKAALGMRSDYMLLAQIQRLEPVAIDKCEMCFWGQDVTKKVLDAIKLQLDGTQKYLQDSLNRTSLRPQMQQVWDKLTSGYKVYNNVWLYLNPEKIRISNFYAMNDSLYITAGLAARPLINFEQRNTPRTLVPDISSQMPRSGFNIYLDAALNYDSLSSLVSTQIKGKRFDFAGGGIFKKYMVIEACELYGSGGDQLVVRIDFSGSDKGTIYLTGKPVLDAATNTLEIKNLDYDLRTRDVLLKTAKWLFDRRIINELNKYSKFELTQYLDTFKTTINTQLNREVIKGIYSSGSISSLQVTGIYPLPGQLVVRCSSSGTLMIRINEIGL
jgi:Domain of unknown function (DUF4403)